MSKFRCVPKSRQRELAGQFNWLEAVDRHSPPPEVHCLSLSVFDHWLSESEALELLPASSTTEQARRDALHLSFIDRLRQETEVLSFAWRGRRKDQPRFRSLTLPGSAHYLSPYDASPAGRFVLPLLSAAYFQGYDDTAHLYLTQYAAIETISRWANGAGLHVLP